MGECTTLLQSTRTQNTWLKCWHLCLWLSFLARISDLRDLQEARLSVSSRFPQNFPSLIAGSQILIFWPPPRPPGLLYPLLDHNFWPFNGLWCFLYSQPSHAFSLSPALASSLTQGRVLSQCSGSLPKWTLLHTDLRTSDGKNSINKIIPSRLNISDEH